MNTHQTERLAMLLSRRQNLSLQELFELGTLEPLQLAEFEMEEKIRQLMKEQLEVCL
jgi:hypothetical protein